MNLLRKILYGVLLLALAGCIWPAYLVRRAQSTAEANGCEFGLPLQKDGCWVDGENIADQLNAAYSSAGLLILTMPLGFVLVVILILMIRKDIRRRSDAA